MQPLAHFGWSVYNHRAMTSVREEAFLYRVVELGLEHCIPNMAAKGLTTYARFAFGPKYTSQPQDTCSAELARAHGACDASNGATGSTGNSGADAVRPPPPPAAARSRDVRTRATRGASAASPPPQTCANTQLGANACARPRVSDRGGQTGGIGCGNKLCAMPLHAAPIRSGCSLLQCLRRAADDAGRWLGFGIGLHRMEAC